jgi:hypothetical protein
MGVRIIPDQSMAFLAYSFKDPDGQEIYMKEEHELV